MGEERICYNDVTERKHIWPPSVMEKDQDSKALVVLMGIIIYGKWDNFGDRKKGRILKDNKLKAD